MPKPLQAERLFARSPRELPTRCRFCEDFLAIPKPPRLKAPGSNPSTTLKPGAAANRCSRLQKKLGRFCSPLQTRAASGSPGRKEPSASRSTGATPYLLAPAGQRPHRVGQVLDPPAVHRQSLLPLGRAGTEA